MKPDLRSLIVLGLFAVVAAWFAASRSGAARGEQAPPEPGSVEAAKTDAVAKTGASAKTDAAKTEAAKGGAAETTPDGKGTWDTVRGYAIGFVTYPLTVAMFIIILSYALGRIIGRRLRMPDFSWKVGLVAFTVIASGFLSWVGIHNAVLRIQRGKPSGPELKFGIDLRGGVDLIYKIKKGEGQTAVDANALIDALRKRIDPNGTKLIVVRLSGADQVEIVVPDVNADEVAEIKRNVTDLGTLEFRILANRRDNRHLELGRSALAIETGAQKEIKEDPEDPESRVEARWVPLDPDIVRQYYDSQKDADGANRGPQDYAAGMFTRALRGNEVLKDPPPPVTDLIEPNPKGGEKYKDNYRAEILVYQDAHDVKGDFLSGVSAGFDEKANPAVNFAFDTEGSHRFTLLTTEFQPPSSNDNFRWHLAVLLNGYVSSAPSLNSVISGRGQISGYHNDERGRKERDRVIAVLKAGQLPAQLDETPLREFRMDSTLGMDTIQKSVVSMIFALGFVFLFMLVYYRFSGVVACVALLLNLLLLVGSMIAIGAALTLPGFAGMVLTVGMAVDSNVLIYERIREEIARGAALRMAIRNGFGKALSAIIDGNLTTILTAIILYAIGTEQLRGFAVTLILGLLISMFTAVFCSRLIFDIAERRRWLTEVKMLKFFEKTNFDFLAPRVKWPAISASLVIIVLGFVAVFFRGKGLYDIEFTGGTAAQVVLDDRGASLTLEQARRRLEQWNQTIEDTSDADLPKALELSSRPDKQRLVRTLEIELLASQADREQDATVQKEKKAQADALRRKLQLVGEGFSPADEKLLKRYDSLDPDERKEFRKLARLDDLTVTLVSVGEDERRPYVNTSNSSQAAVEGILEKVFEGQLASKGFEMEPMEKSKASSSSSTTEKPAAEKTSAEKTAGGKTPEAKTDAGKKPPESAKTPESSKTPEKAQPEAGKTNAGKKDAGKTEPAKKTSGLVSPQEPSWVAFMAADDELLLAQADPPAKTTDAKTADKDASAKSPPAEAEPGKKAPDALPAPVEFKLTFVDKIGHVTVESAIRAAARSVLAPDATTDIAIKDPRVRAVIASIKVTNPDYVSEANQSFDTWTVSINESDATVRQILERANSMLQEEPLFPASNNFGPLVSRKMKIDAIVAIIASWIGILVYLWVRFQKVSFGLAAVVALIHDVLVALAFMAFSYWIAQLGIPYIDPFKINLDVVAAFLTLIGYSVNDTIVIFDRVREIKGKSPDLTAEMINRAVNETLSRTIITSGLTFLVVVAQFFFGGQSIHAFAFCLVIGLIAGTYSTIYIASPVLLWSSRLSQKKRHVQPTPSRESELVRRA